MASRLTQHVLEVLSTLEVVPPSVGARLTQHVLEVLSTPGSARLTQHLLEVLSTRVPEPSVPVPGTTPPSGTVQLTVQLQAALLTDDGRIPLTRHLVLPGEVGDMLEVVLPDGTFSRHALPSRAGQVVALLVTSDKAVQVCVGDPAQNQPLMLAPWGVYVCMGSDLPGEQTCALSYTPGDGSLATCVVLTLIQARSA